MLFFFFFFAVVVAIIDSDVSHGATPQELLCPLLLQLVGSTHSPELVRHLDLGLALIRSLLQMCRVR